MHPSHHFLQVLQGDVSVELGAGDPGMPQDRLNVAKVRAVTEHLGGHRAKPVRAHALGEDVAGKLVVELGRLNVGARIEEHGILFQQVQEKLPNTCQAFPLCAVGENLAAVSLKRDPQLVVSRGLSVSVGELFGAHRSQILQEKLDVSDKELDEKSNVQKMHIASGDRPVAFYDLDVIIAVGYRVNSKRGTQFRIWATRFLNEHLVRGYSASE
jgi:hypothetical protein